MEQALLNLWKAYRGQMSLEELNEILERGHLLLGNQRVAPDFSDGDEPVVPEGRSGMREVYPSL